MSTLWEKLNDRTWLPEFGEVVIQYQDWVPVRISRKDSERLDPDPLPLIPGRKLPVKDSTTPLDNEKLSR